jgi:hypothetical protein
VWVHDCTGTHRDEYFFTTEVSWTATQGIETGAGPIGTDQHGLAGLEDLVVGADADGSAILLVVEAACRGDGLMQDVGERSQRQRIIEEVAEQFLDAAERTVAEERKTEDELLEPRLGEGEPEEKLRRVGRCWVEGLVDRVVGVVELLVDELAADVVLVSQGGAGLSGDGLEGHGLAFGGGHQPSGVGREGCVGLG